MASQFRLLRAVLLAVAIADIFLFSSISLPILIILFIGTALTGMGYFTNYRLTSLLGIISLGSGVAISIKMDTLLEISMIMSAVFGIFLPLFTIGIITLPNVEHVDLDRLKTKRHLYFIVSFVGACILAAPIAGVLFNAFAPSIALNLSTLIEIALMLVAITIGTVILISIRSKEERIGQEKKTVE